MKKWKSQLLWLGCALILTACGNVNKSDVPAASSLAQRIAGLDADNNGVRDDIDAYINTRYSDVSQRAAALQTARAIQQDLLVDKTDKPAVKLAALAETRAVHCLFSKFHGPGPLQPSAVSSAIESMTANTKERLSAYLAFSKALNGTTAQLPTEDTCD